MCVLHDIIPDTTQQNNPFHEKLLALFDSILFICVPLDHYCINHKNWNHRISQWLCKQHRIQKMILRFNSKFILVYCSGNTMQI